MCNTAAWVLVILMTFMVATESRERRRGNRPDRTPGERPADRTYGELISSLFVHNEQRSRPNIDLGPVIVSVQLKLRSVSVDIDAGTFTTTMDVTQTWNDLRMTFSSDKYSTVTLTGTTNDKFYGWVPDTCFFDNFLSGQVIREPVPCEKWTIKQDGTVIQKYSFRGTFSCDGLRKVQARDATCRIILSSYSYGKKDVSYVFRTGGVVLADNSAGNNIVVRELRTSETTSTEDGELYSQLLTLFEFHHN